MAENLLSSAASAVTGEVTRVLFSGLMGKLDRKTAAADMKLRRLGMLLIKINSAVEASEKHAIENASLLKWRDRLKEAAAEVSATPLRKDTKTGPSARSPDSLARSGQGAGANRTHASPDQSGLDSRPRLRPLAGSGHV